MMGGAVMTDTAVAAERSHRMGLVNRSIILKALVADVSSFLEWKNPNGFIRLLDNGISYECRTLLFKALHNLIER
ncbi:MED13L [Cordylochernes scorpioides]|uniref:MED13L n=1 Tax=Cordylochernes scorpioides TaxID=51811 RepID=A0ABY6K0D4_9ARAC|nr:MED13L [Cordylochernes scorpioides]